MRDYSRLATLLLASLLFPLYMKAQGKVVINEIMQSNVDFMMVNHDFPDSWVELYNGSNKKIKIDNYRIGPSNIYDKSQRIAQTVEYIEPGGHLLLFCDKTTGTPFHYSFNLEAGKGQLFLFDNSGIAIDSLSYEKMPAPNVAFGRTKDGSGEWQYEMTPTPRAPNNSAGSNYISSEPVFSSEGHLMTGAETITISIPQDMPEDTRIHLTMDGSEPTWESASATQFTLQIDKSTIVRAKLLSQEMLPIRSTTHSYIFHPRETGLPIVSIATDSTYLYSSSEGILSNDSTDGMPNYSYEWRRPANFEYFRTSDRPAVFNQSGEMAVSGGATRAMPQKSIKCYAKKRFGKKNFKGDFWRDKPEVTKVKSFTLRNGGNNCKAARIIDAAVQKFFGTNLDEIDWQAYEPVIVYINGVYKGVYGFRERSNEDYVTSNYDVDEEDVEVGTASSYMSSRSDTPHFNELLKLYGRDDVTYEELAGAINVENFMNVFIAECYASNTDFPHNNVSFWTQTNDKPCWNWILKDLDFVTNHGSSFDMFKYMLGTEDTETTENQLSQRANVIVARKLYERMMSFPEFRDRFIATYATYLGDFLRPDVCLPIVRAMDEEIIDEIAPTFAAYDNMSTLKKHNIYIDRFYNYITLRPDIVYKQMADYFHLGETIPVCITDEDEGDKSITICGSPLRTGRFCGAWFTQFPFSIETPDGSCTSWTMIVTHSDGSESKSVYDTAKIQPDMTSCAAGDSVTFIASDAKMEDAISACNANNNRTVTAIHDASGKTLPSMQHGLNIITYSDGTRRIIYQKE